MMADLTGIPFDHYQRYAAAAAIVQSLEPLVGTVIEVGANRQRLLGEFLPQARVLYTDIEAQEGLDDFVVADAAALPFGDRVFEAVVSLDVLEHIPPAARASAVAEMARVAGRIVVIGCPIDLPATHAAERAADAVWRGYFNASYPWLEEHQTYGLVDPLQVEEQLVRAGMRVVRLGQGDAGLWSDLMGAHFVKEAVPELRGMVAAMDRCYNRHVFPFDWAGSAYRQLFVGVRGADEAVAPAKPQGTPETMAKDAAEALRAIASAMHPVAKRVLTAEREWKATAEALRRASESAGEQLRRADASDRRAVELDVELGHALAALNESQARQQEAEGIRDALGARLRSLEERLEETAAQLNREALAHHETGLKLRHEALSAVAQFERAEAADRRTVELQAKLARVHEDLALASRSLELSGERNATLEGDVSRLQLRVHGLERRQRLALYAVAAAAISALAAWLLLR